MRFTSLILQRFYCCTLYVVRQCRLFVEDLDLVGITVCCKDPKMASRRFHLGAIFFTNLSIIFVCLTLFLEMISLGTSRWYIRHNDFIKYRHGGLWSMCMGDIARTFCSPFIETPDWLIVCRAFIISTVCVTLITIIYAIVALARGKLKMKVMIVFCSIRCVIFLIGVVIYAMKGFPVNFTYGYSYYVAWVTFATQLVTLLLWIYSYVRISGMSKMVIYEAGIVI